jgi:hypothetical protein
LLAARIYTRDSGLGLTKKHLETPPARHHNRLKQVDMVDACPFDRNILFCLMRYEPEVLLLLFLALVCAFCLWKFMG